MKSPEMVDNFALLNVPRRPWLDVELLKQKFLARSSEIHPDRAHGEGAVEREAATRRFAELNAAWQCLREPKDRLGHLLELELGGKPKDAQDVPTEAVDLFFETGRLCREADVFLAAKEKTTSPLVKAQMFGEGMDLAGRLNELLKVIGGRREALVEEVKAIDSRQWTTGNEQAKGLSLEALERIYRMLSYVARWTAQIQERVVRLSF